MRTVLAVLLAVTLALAAMVPHVHLGPDAADGCAVCVVRGSADVARSQAPDVAPRAAPAVAVVLAPGLHPVTGAPLGAVPGQSPPAA
jgi:hypothetical protein